MLALISLAWLSLFFFFLFASIPVLNLSLFIPSYPPSCTSSSLPHTFSLLACFRCCFTWWLWLQTSQLHSQHLELTDYRALSSGCLLLLLRVGRIFLLGGRVLEEMELTNYRISNDCSPDSPIKIPNHLTFFGLVMNNLETFQG